MSEPTDQQSIVRAFIVGAAGTAVIGAVVQALVVPTSGVSVDRWSYPWTAGPFVAVSLLYTVLHFMVAAGLAAFGRVGATGGSPSARRGTALAVAGTLTLAAGEVLGLPIRNALTDDTSAQIVGSVFGLGVVLSAIGFLMVGMSTLRAGVWHGWRRIASLATGIWTTVMIVVPIGGPKALPGSVAVYGIGLLAIALALHGNAHTAQSRLQSAV